MKKIKLGLIAVALIGGFTAFATNVDNDAPDCTDQQQINQDCNGTNVDCCITREPGLEDPNTGQAVPTGTLLLKAF